MPYIKQKDREKFAVVDLADHDQIANAGELNYLFTTLALSYLFQHGKDYRHINDVIGALESAKLEFYRRAAAPYEDLKIQENGDVYPAARAKPHVPPLHGPNGDGDEDHYQGDWDINVERGDPGARGKGWFWRVDASGVRTISYSSGTVQANGPSIEEAKERIDSGEWTRIDVPPAPPVPAPSPLTPYEGDWVDDASGATCFYRIKGPNVFTVSLRTSAVDRAYASLDTVSRLIDKGLLRRVENGGVIRG